MTYFMRPLQHLHPEVIGGQRLAGELVFPDGVVLAPDHEFRARVEDVRVVWNEWVDRAHGGGFVRPHPVPAVPSDVTEVIETGQIELRTDHGAATIAIVDPRRIAVVLRHVRPAQSYWFGVEKVTAEIGSGEMRQEISFWQWKEPRPASEVP